MKYYQYLYFCINLLKIQFTIFSSPMVIWVTMERSKC